MSNSQESNQFAIIIELLEQELIGKRISKSEINQKSEIPHQSQQDELKKKDLWENIEFLGIPKKTSHKFLRFEESKELFSDYPLHEFSSN